MASQNTTSNNASSVDGQGREGFSSRLGFLLISAGCAIGLGNIWRFPYITGQYGGAAFVLMILFFLVVLGVPLLVMEFSVGRASHRSLQVALVQVVYPCRQLRADDVLHQRVRLDGCLPVQNRHRNL